MTKLNKKDTQNFMCRLSPEDHQKLKIISAVNNRSMTSQVRQYIQDDYNQDGLRLEEIVSNRDRLKSDNM